MVNRLCIAELRLLDAEEVMKKGQKSFEEKVADLEHSMKELSKQRDSASQRQREAVKDCKKDQEKAEKANKRDEEAIADARGCQTLIIDN